MAFDSQTRNALAKLTADARTLLVAEFTRQLQTIYGIQPTGQISELESLDHLDDEQRAVAGVLRDRICHLTAGNLQDKKGLAEAVSRLIREQSFTVLNRFAALRMCEERGLVQQCVGADVRSKGFQVYIQTAGAGLGDQYDRYRTYLFCLFDEISLDLGVLFNRYSTCGLLFPRETTLFELLAILNRKELAHVWVEDEAIGWIYQYYNDPAERKKMREESSAPRNSRELAVRNQFFTPRYVVEFLSDNTLGRIWYEMTKGMTRLKDQCRYLVRRPNEFFLAPGETPPAENQEPLTKNQERTQDDLLRAPVHIPHRPIKDPRDIRMLDPACGSMHFGLYCFDLFEAIYEEAWDIAKSNQVPAGADPSFSDFCLLTSEYSSKKDFLRQVPRHIIEHNIHGIDIDPRCTQIAGLSLWLRAQKAWKSQGVKPADRLRILRSNIVCAEPMPGDKALLRDFVESEFPAMERAVCQRLLETIFDKMQLAGEAGSLLKIEEEIRSAIEDARDAWQKLATRPRELFTTTELNQISTAPELSGLEQAVASLPSALCPQTSASAPRNLATDFWERIEERLYAALRDYAEQAEHSGGFQRRLFAEDAARGFAFIDVCRKRYDVALMNPPFGEPATATIEYINKRYPNAFIDVLAAFVERTTNLCSDGRVGALTSRACLYTKTLADWRRNHFLSNIETVADLGGGVLDGALVFACASVFALPSSKIATCQAFDLRKSNAREMELLEDIKELSNTRIAKGVHLKDRGQLSQINNARFLYNIPDGFWSWSHALKTLVDAGGSARAGSTTYDDFRFLRLVWESPSRELGWEKTWIFFSKGGYFETFYNDLHLLVNWQNNGREVGEFNRIGYGTDAQSKRASTFYKRAGVTYPRRTVKGFSPRALPADCIFADKGPVIFSPDGSDLNFALGYWNSAPIRALVHLQVQAGSFETGVVNSVPWLESITASNEISTLAKQAWKKKAEIYQLWESDRRFIPPHLSSASSLAQFAVHVQKQWGDNTSTVIALCRRISDCVSTAFSLPEIDFEAFEVSPDDHAIEDDFGVSEDGAFAFYFLQIVLGCAFGRWDIRYATGERTAPELPDPFAPLPVCPPGQLQNAQGLPARPEDVPSAYPVRIPWDGILVDDPNHPLDLERRVREIIEIIWKDRADAIEAEACELLGVKSLRDYFCKPARYFAAHLKRYSKSRRQAPLYWPLSTASGSYTLWLYYHRLTSQTLFQCVTDFLEPKIREVSRDIERLQKGLIDGGTAAQRDELDALMDFRLELEGLKTELLRVVRLPYKPDLNDGVIINAAPLWKVFRLKKWQKDCRECWEELESGAYDWAHLAFHIWPDRVREKCRTDKSLAIAHNLEELCEKPPAKPKKRAANKTPEEELAL
jgi:hypothetical protein